MDDHKKTQHLSELLWKLTDGNIDDSELREFEDELRNNPQARRYYVESKIIHSLFRGRKSIPICEPHPSAATEWNETYLNELGEYEKKAPKIEIPKEEPQRELIQKVVYPTREKRKLNKLGILSLALNAAAILFFVLFLKIAPSKKGVEVATLTNSVHAKWGGNAAFFEQGTRVATGNELVVLREGYAELLFDNQARVTVEGPAGFQILAEDRIALNYGKIYSRIPKEAIGFSVYTQKAKIIDLGTEFGVAADRNGQTELHVFKGKTLLFTRQVGQASKGINISVGQAGHISSQGHLSVISAEQGKFVRSIESGCAVIADFQEQTDNNLPAGWNLVDNNGKISGPFYTNLINLGPLRYGDTCARIELAPDSAKATPNGWIQCLKSFDAQSGFYGSFEFCMEDTKGSPDMHFLFGDISGEKRNYFYVAISGTKRDLHEMFTVAGEHRTLFARPTVLSDIMPEVWYRFLFQFIPSQGTTGYFTYKVTDIEGRNTYLTMESKEITLPDTVRFGLGTKDNVVRFDNVKIFASSE